MEAEELATVPYFLVAMRPGDNYENRADFYEQHLAFIEDLSTKKLILLGGDWTPELDNFVLAYILHADNLAHATELSGKDPLVASGAYRAQAVQWDLVGITMDAIDPRLDGASPTVGRVKSATLGISVTDLEQATDWYKKLLGEVEIMDPAPGIRELQLTDSSWLQLIESEEETSSGAVLNLETLDIEASHLTVAKLDPQVSSIEVVPDAVKYFSFSDPFGNQLSFYELLG